MAQKSDSALQTQNDTIQTETTANANTAARIGQMYEDIIDSKINNDKIVDEDDMVSNSATLVPTQQSVKTYVDAVVASDIAFTPAGTIAATNVQAAIEEVASEAGGGGAVSSVFTRTGAVTAATSDYDAAQIDNTPAGGIAATNVQDALNELDTDKAPLASPTFTGVPAAPTAAVGTDTTQVATTAFVRANALVSSASTLYPGQVSFNALPIETEGIGANNLEIINIGNPGFVPQGTETRNIVPGGIFRIGGNIMLFRNLEWDTVNLKYLTPYQDVDAYGSGMLEMGGEAVILHATPHSVDFTDVPHEILLASARGTDGGTNQQVTSGYYLQSKAPIYARFSSLAYDPEDTNNAWNQTSGVDPLLWLSSSEAKNTENEFARLEMNANSSTAWPAIYLAKSRGTLGVKTIAVTGEVMGKYGWKAYDGDEYHITAYIDAVTRGTMANNAVGMSMRFLTSATNTAGATVRMELGHDGAIKNFTPWRYEVSAITTIPNLTAFLTTPVLSSGSCGQVQNASGSTGGLRFFGFSTTSTASTARALMFTGVLGATAPTAPAVTFQAMKHNGTTSTEAVAATEIVAHFLNDQTNLIEILGNGNTGFGVTSPTALVHVAASSTARAGLCVVPGAAPTSPVNGDIWIDSTAHTMHVRINGVTKTFTLS